jgi:alkaline phosphatase D
VIAHAGLTRRQFLWTAAAASVLWPDIARTQPNRIFQHGVASGDPLGDRVILWTRVTPANASSSVDVRWRVATDERMTAVVSSGSTRTSADRDFTVKIDAAGLQPGRPYFYAFEAAGESSPVGRTKTAAAAAIERLRFAVMSCSNYPAGYFNPYRCVANRDDLDGVIHVGDYIYEFENGVYGDGSGLLRIPEPRREAVTLSDYRIRYATYRSDPDLQAAHARHPFVAVWDDHELTDNAWRDGAGNHNPDLGEGEWPTRRAAAWRAYLEWMPIRPSARFARSGQPSRDIRLYRRFRFGTLADVIMLDTRGLRDQQPPGDDLAALADPRRTLLGAAQEAWTFDQLRESQRAGVAWRLLGQQVMFSRLVPPGRPVLTPDTWEGYQAARERLVDFLTRETVRDLAILSGDIHSSWGFDVARNPFSGYSAATGAGSLAVEIVTPAISSAPLMTSPVIRDRMTPVVASLPHLKHFEGAGNGYVLLDITRDRLRSDWYLVPGVLERSAAESLAASLVSERGSSRLTPA